MRSGGNADLVRRCSAAAVGLIAGTMLVAWIAGLTIATRTDTLAPMSPLACVAFLAGALGVGALPSARGLAVGGGIWGSVGGGGGIADAIVTRGTTLTRALFGPDPRLSILTAL